MSTMRSRPDGQRRATWLRRPATSERNARRGMLLIVLVGLFAAMTMVLITALVNFSS
jgi:hypothetical protein